MFSLVINSFRTGVLARRGLHITSVIRNEGSAEQTKHILESLKQKIIEQEQVTVDIKQKLVELEAKYK